MGNILVSGSIAYDNIMDFSDKFENHIKSENLGKLSVSFVVDKLKKERGGTGLNISYNLALIGKKSILVGAIGKDYDFGEFLSNNVNFNYVFEDLELFSSSCYVTSDTSGNQITTFYPGAMLSSDETSIFDIKEKLSYAIVSPNKKEAMLKHLFELKSLGIKTFFDPGQAIFSMNKKDLEIAIKNSSFLIANDYEFDYFKDLFGIDEEKLISKFEKVIITLGEKGSIIVDGKNKIFIPVVKNENVVDPTGAGDAYRGGLLTGLDLGYDFEISGKMGSLLASISVGKFGGQNHFITKENFEKKFKEEFGLQIKL